MTRAHAVVQQARVYPVLMEPVSYFGQTDSKVSIFKAELDRVHVASREGGGRAAKTSPPPSARLVFAKIATVHRGSGSHVHGFRSPITALYKGPSLISPRASPQ